MLEPALYGWIIKFIPTILLVWSKHFIIVKQKIKKINFNNTNIMKSLALPSSKNRYKKNSLT